MKTVLKTLSISLLLAINIAGAYADSGRRQEWREDMRAAHYQQVNDQGDQRRGERQKSEQNRERELSNSVTQEESRKSGRMKPEERRTLRRQINEAGRDIYTPPGR
jgi:hypothetical protein